MNRLKRDYPSTWLSMLIDFETKKRGANPENSTGINMTISHQFAKQFEKYSGEDLEDRIKKRKSLGVKFSNGMLRVSGDTLRNMYQEVIPNIRAHLKGIFKENNDQAIAKMFVVGGFAESAYLQEFLTSEFGRNVKIYIPEEAGMCVIKGAVLFGHNTEYITSRIARFNYAIPFYRRFDESKHDIRRKVTLRGKEMISILETLVHKGQKLKISDTVSVAGSFTEGEEIAETPLMSTDTDTDDPKHPSVTILEKIEFRNANIQKKERKITNTLQFGGTDILMKVFDHDSGKEAQATVQF